MRKVIMKSLKSVISKEIKTYPKDPELEVEFLTDIPIGIADKLQDESLSNLDKMVIFITHIVSDWNFADSNGEKLPITKESVSLLGKDIITWMVEEAQQLIKPDESKKKD